MNILGGLDEFHDNVFSTLIERMLSESITIDDEEELLLSHECRLKRRNIIVTSPLPLINLKNQPLLMNPKCLIKSQLIHLVQINNSNKILPNNFIHNLPFLSMTQFW